MTYTPSQRARFVTYRIEESQETAREGLREASLMNGKGEELRARLQTALDALADARAEADELYEWGRTR